LWSENDGNGGTGTGSGTKKVPGEEIVGALGDHIGEHQVYIKLTGDTFRSSYFTETTGTAFAAWVRSAATGDAAALPANFSVHYGALFDDNTRLSLTYTGTPRDAPLVENARIRIPRDALTHGTFLDGDLFVVVTGCMVDMIGDDTASVVAEFKNAGKPVIAVPTPSFKGNAFLGYELLFKGLIDKYIEKSEKKDPLAVNVLGIVPAQDVFWKGNLREIKRLLEKLGLKANTFFGESETLENFKNAGKAGLNIVVSNSFGIESARYFEEEHGIPSLVTPFPIGALAGEDFLKTVGNALNIAPKHIEKVIAQEKSVYYDYLERLSDLYNDIDLQRYAVIVGDSNYAPALTRFLSDELGWLPELAVVTDFPDESGQKAIGGQLDRLNSGVKPRLYFDGDTSSVKKYLRDVWPRNRNSRYYDSFGPAVILGSAFERDIAQEFGFPLVPVSFPLTNRCVMNRAYAGFTGGLSLTEDIISYLVAGR
jgi:nitrogenase molybdenum-iron protein beta chain